jgi:hypothetical protein
MMQSQQWFEQIDWLGLVLGTLVGIALSALIGFFFALLDLPTDGLLVFLLTEIAIGLAGLFTGGLAVSRGNSAVLSGLATGLLCAFVSLVASVVVDPTGVSILGTLVLFTSYPIMAVLGAWAMGSLVARSRPSDTWQQW